MADKFGRDSGCFLFFAAHVVDDLAFEAGHDDVNVNRFGLTESPATPDGLVVRLVTVRQPNERHSVTLLKVHAEPGDRSFGYEHTNVAVLERFERLGFGVWCP